MSQDWPYLDTMLELRRAGAPFVEVTLVEAQGSTPQDAGSRMLVNAAGLVCGTVGGGRIEAKALELAQTMLAPDATSDAGRTRLVKWNLQTDVGMTCGGIVTLFFEAVHVHDWQIVIFGAGHVTQAVARLLITLPCMVRCIDPRQEWLARLPPGIVVTCTDDPPAHVASIPTRAFVLCMTRGHKSDLPVLVELYKCGRPFPYVGVIGSKSKATVLRRELTEAGISPDALTFYCPVGAPIGSNHPGEIAVSIAAQLLEVRGRNRERAQ